LGHSDSGGQYFEKYPAVSAIRGVVRYLVHNPAMSTTAVLEVTTLIAMTTYAIVAWLVGRLVWLAQSRPRWVFRRSNRIHPIVVR
jgi:hypothetical protein